MSFYFAKAQEPFAFKGKVSNGEVQSVIELTTWPLDGAAPKSLAKTTLEKNGTYNFGKNASNAPYLMLNYKKMRFVVPNNGKSNIELNFDASAQPPVLTGKGSPELNAWLEFRAFRAKLNDDLYKGIMEESTSLTEKKKKELEAAGTDETALKQIAEKYKPEENALTEKFMAASQKSSDALAKKAEDCSHAAVLYLIATAWDENMWLNTGQATIEKITKKEGQNAYTDALNAKMKSFQALSVGAIAPELELTDSTGKTFKLSDMRGQYVLVDFWASWCKPCRIENPNVVANYEKYKDKGFTVLGISLDDNRDRWLVAVQADKLFWPHASDLKGWESAAGRKYNITSIPANVLLDKDGKIVAKNLRDASLGDKLKEIFGN